MALRCWHCNSVDQPYCTDPFDTDQLNAAQRAGNIADCQKGDFGAPVCIKMISTRKYIFPSEFFDVSSKLKDGNFLRFIISENF